MTTAVFDKEAFEEMVNMTGYESKTTFWDDFCIAERFGHKAIKDTFNRAFNEWKSNIEYITELVMILNWRMWRLADFDEIPQNCMKICGESQTVGAWTI